MIIKLIEQHPKAAFAAIAISLIAFSGGGAKRYDKHGNLIESDDIKKTLINADKDLKLKQIEVYDHLSKYGFDDQANARSYLAESQQIRATQAVQSLGINKTYSLQNHANELNAGVQNHQISANQDVANNQTIAKGATGGFTSILGAVCYLTTIVCKYNDYPDDCHYLQTLRNYRDNVLMTSGIGRELCIMYYAHQSIISDKLQKFSEKAKAEFFTPLINDIKDCVNAIECGNDDLAIEIYLRLFNKVWTFANG